MKIGTGAGQTAKWLLVMVMAFGASVAMAGIATTKHNLGSTQTVGNEFSGTDEICVFCHTPHGADIAAAAPLWNKTHTAPTYTLYSSLGSATIDGQETTVGSVSLACLSCHDGTQAMNSVINAPGSGVTNAAYTGGVWSGTNVTAGGLLGAGITNLGSDLRNDHPIGIQYCGGGLTGAASVITGTCNDADFKLPVTQNINSAQQFWVENATSGAGRQKGDMILYTRTTLTGPSVECASCHDPHSVNGTFLRIPNTGSAVCLTCHIK